MPITLTITLDESGGIALQGPVSNAALCYGMLELAKDAIRAHNMKESQLVKPASGPLPFGPIGRT